MSVRLAGRATLVSFDADNGTLLVDCASFFGGAATYGGCFRALLNGEKALSRRSRRNRISLMTTAALLRLLRQQGRAQGVESVVFCDIFDHVGPLRAGHIVRVFREAAGFNCRCYAAGVAPAGKQAGGAHPVTEMADGGRWEIGVRGSVSSESAIDAPWIPPQDGSPNVVPEFAFDPAARDEIDVISDRSRFGPDWLRIQGGWVCPVGPERGERQIVKKICEAIQRVDCPRLRVTDLSSKSGCRLSPSLVADCLRHVGQKFPQMNFSVACSGRWLESADLKALAESGLDLARIELSPADLGPGPAARIERIVRDCSALGVQVALGGQVIERGAGWAEFRKAWNFYDRIGGDFLATLWGVPWPGVEVSRPAGWTARALNELTGKSSVLQEYRRAQKALSDPTLPHCVYASLPTLYRVTHVYARRELLGKVAQVGVLKGGEESLRKAAKYALSVLSNIPHRYSNACVCGTRGEVSPKSTFAVSEVGVVVPTANNGRHLRVCLQSLCDATSVPFQVYVVDHGSAECPSSCLAGLTGVDYRRVSYSNLKSVAVAWGLLYASEHRYVLLLDSNTCVLAPDLLSEMIGELEASREIGAVGIRAGSDLDYRAGDNAKHLLKYVLAAEWKRSVGAEEAETDEALLKRLSVPGKSCFNGLTGIAQLYRGDVLRRIGVPAVGDNMLKEAHWDCELSMRVLACGWRIEDSIAARHRLHYFGRRYDSGVEGVSSYGEDVLRDREWLAANGQASLGRLFGPE